MQLKITATDETGIYLACLEDRELDMIPSKLKGHTPSCSF